MRNRKIINLTFISIVALAGVIIMQAFWVSLTIKATRAHTKEHVLNVLISNKSTVCSFLNDNQLEKAKEYSTKVVQRELNNMKKKIVFQLSIKEINANKKINLFEDQCINLKLDCRNSPKTYLLKVDCRDNSWVFGGQIFWWVILSVVMVFLIAMAIALSLINQQKHKKLELIKKDFVSNMTHELKTPIATISVASEMLLKTENPFMNKEKAQRYLQIIYDENHRLQKLVDKVLILSIFDKTGDIYKMEKVDMCLIIEESIKSIDLLAREKQAKIIYNIPEKPIFINGDKSHLRQIVSNILENALKYSVDNPEIFIKTHPSTDRFILEIGDNGPGISQKDKELIFNRFYRVSQGNVHNVKGHGLGLFYVQKVMKAHGGTIVVKDNKPKGAIFQMIFPR